jgi:hypothetical protein
VASGGQSAAADEVWKLPDGRTAADAEPGAKIIPEGDAELPACLGEPEECIAAVATDIAVGSAADVTFGDLATDAVFRAICVQRNFRVIEHHQQFVFVGVQLLQQAIKGDEACTALEDAIEARPHFTASPFEARPTVAVFPMGSGVRCRRQLDLRRTARPICYPWRQKPIHRSQIAEE